MCNFTREIINSRRENNLVHYMFLGGQWVFWGASGFSDSLAPRASGCHSPMSRPVLFLNWAFGFIFLIHKSVLVATDVAVLKYDLLCKLQLMFHAGRSRYNAIFHRIGVSRVFDQLIFLPRFNLN